MNPNLGIKLKNVIVLFFQETKRVGLGALLSKTIFFIICKFIRFKKRKLWPQNAHICGQFSNTKFKIRSIYQFSITYSIFEKKNCLKTQIMLLSFFKTFRNLKNSLKLSCPDNSRVV